MITMLKREGDRVFWRHNSFDGDSWIVAGQASHTEVSNPDYMLTNPARKKITKAVNEWLVETGEGAKWIEENSQTRRRHDPQI